MIELSEAYEECKRITKNASSTFYIGSNFFPSELKYHVWAIYAFCRTTDDLVDNASQHGFDLSLKSEVARLKLLLDIRRSFIMNCAERANLNIDALQKLDIQDQAVFIALNDSFKNFADLAPRPFLRLIDGVESDLNQTTYQTISDLADYCDMVAGGVGEMICNLCGIGDSEAVCYAHMLGESMQMTNILRDVGEDLRMGRVYLPQVDLPIEKVDLLYLLHRAENDLWGVHDNGYKAETLFKEFMKEYIEMTRKSYSNATKGLKYLPNSVARPIRIASDMYEGILKKIEENDFNVFTKRAYIRKRERIGIIFNRVISNPVS